MKNVMGCSIVRILSQETIIYNTDMRYRYAIQICNADMQCRYATKICNTDVQYRYAIQICNKDMQSCCEGQHAADSQQRYATKTGNTGMQYRYARKNPEGSVRVPWGFREEQQAVRGSMTPGTNIYPQRRARTASSMQQCATVCSSMQQYPHIKNIICWWGSMLG